ncbi:hypothetical protein [Vibrio sp. D431a]|uniref:hypothetical protein n=1 Tax=Vibrio sp. D431a TaxID=2837388 RepID=UPI002557C043|nr:hypothetical protein [Vibrio sp. D431a]MDK9793890.1 hypothetical protein [Vibrio sp. D431a]
MITILFTLLIVMAVLAVKEMANAPEKDFPEAATDGCVVFYKELKTVLSKKMAKKSSDKSESKKDESEESKKEVKDQEAKETE